MKVKAVKEFADKYILYKMYKVGDVIDVTEDRAKDMIERGLATALEPSAKKEVKKTVPKKRQTKKEEK